MSSATKRTFFANNVDFFDALDKFYQLTIDYNADKKFKDFIGTEWLLNDNGTGSVKFFSNEYFDNIDNGWSEVFSWVEKNVEPIVGEVNIEKVITTISPTFSGKEIKNRS